VYEQSSPNADFQVHLLCCAVAVAVPHACRLFCTELFCAVLCCAVLCRAAVGFVAAWPVCMAVARLALLCMKHIAMHRTTHTIDPSHFGHTSQGKVTGVMDFGCFVELLGFRTKQEGLVHLSNISSTKRAGSAKDMVGKGERRGRQQCCRVAVESEES
jgi:hypothetical protein